VGSGESLAKPITPKSPRDREKHAYGRPYVTGTQQ
jgi:hypothetical protein